MGVKYFINLPLYFEVLADKAAQVTAANVVIEARKRVRKDSRALHNSLRTDKISPSNYEASAGGGSIKYALAQEYGLAPFGLPQYGYTPYMRPAAFIAAGDEKMQEAATAGADAAARQAAI